MQKNPTHHSSRAVIALMALASSLPVIVTSAQAGEGGYYGGYSSLAQREMIRRQDAVAEGDRLLQEGRDAYAKKDYQTAVDKYRQALNRLPNAPMFADRRAEYVAHLGDASVALSIQDRRVGKYDEARQLLEDVLKEDPNNIDAKRELGFLDDPIRTNPALTYEHTQNVDKVRRTLYIAEGNFNLGKYDEAKEQCENVLRIDPYNTAARRWMERIASAKSDYYRAAYDHTRAELLSQVDQAWELAVPPEVPTELPGYGTANQLGIGVQYIQEKLRAIIIPRIDFEDTTVEEAVDFLRLRSRELDTAEMDPNRKGVNFVVRKPKTSSSGGGDAGLDTAEGGETASLTVVDPGAIRINELRVRNVPLAVALKYICDATKLRYKVDEYAVTLLPQGGEDDEIFQRTFSVPPDFQAQLGGGEGDGTPENDDPFGDDAGAKTSGIKPKPPVIDQLKAAGIKFPDGTSATLSATGTLIVTNTPTELDKVEALVNEIIKKQPKQVKITTKFVEVSQENTDELGFDWIINPFDLNAPGSILGSGAGIGNQSGRSESNYPLIPGSTAFSPSYGMSNGLRSGDTAINRNGIDAILNNPNRTSQTSSVAPGIMALTGLFTDGQVQLIMRGLAQKKGTDLMTAPSVMARSGQKATIEIIREFIYPTEYEPPELPNTVGSSFSSSSIIDPTLGLTGSSSSSSFPVTPATPTAFETRNTGVTLEIEPVIGENDFVIDLRFVPEIVEFEGFINYGSPIQSPGTDSLGNPVSQIITENRIEMPVFASRKVNTQLTIYDGYTVAVGGLMREDVQNVEDKVPVFGDLPIIGRLFQSKSENRIKSNLIIFVTAQVIDATGRPLRGPGAANQPTTTPVMGGGVPDDLGSVLPPM